MVYSLQIAYKAQNYYSHFISHLHSQVLLFTASKNVWYFNNKCLQITKLFFL